MISSSFRHRKPEHCSHGCSLDDSSLDTSKINIRGKVLPWDVGPDDVGSEDINISVVDNGAQDVAEYCLPLLVVHFCGQTSCIGKKCPTDEDKTASKKTVSLKNYLKVLDTWLRQFENVTDFTGKEEEFKLILRLISRQRYRKDLESVDDCYKRLLRQSKRFIKIYHKREELSYAITKHNEYWGTRQQLLAGKVIGDWVDKKNRPLDPIFGALLCPTAGRTDPGDSELCHNILFDDRGPIAYHSAFHDAFGYLYTSHNTGPGYKYLNGSTWFNTNHCLSGQITALYFWKNVIEEIETERMKIENWRC